MWLDWIRKIGSRRTGRARLGHKWRSFASARKWARSQKLSGSDAWKNIRKPKDIPVAAYRVYKKEWKNWDDFLGTGKIRYNASDFLSYSQAKRRARKMRIASGAEWGRLAQAKSWPKDLPRNPERTYREHWQSWPHFLGTDPATFNREYRSFVRARSWARAQDFKSRADWNLASKQKRLPKDIPATPDRFYSRMKQWKSWPDFLGTQNIAPGRFKARPYIKARNWARNQSLTSSAAWKSMVKELKAKKKWPVDIPTNPNHNYHGQWRGWEDFLGLQKMAQVSKIETRLAYELASVIAQISPGQYRISVPDFKKTYKVDVAMPLARVAIEYDGAYFHKGQRDRDKRKTHHLGLAGWELIRIREAPLRKLSENDIVIQPNTPIFELTRVVLTQLERLGYVDSGVVARYERRGKAHAIKKSTAAIRSRFKSYKDARAWAHVQGIISYSDWRRKKSSLPRDIPADPYAYYRSEGTWKSWSNFLGTKNMAPGTKKWRKFSAARKWARSLGLNGFDEWHDYIKTEMRPDDIPAAPERVYAGLGWESWSDWLDTSHGRVRRYRPSRSP